MEVENLASREMDTTYLSLVEVVVFKAWVKERWEEREVERLTRQRPAVQRSELLYPSNPWKGSIMHIIIRRPDGRPGLVPEGPLLVCGTSPGFHY